MSGKYKLKMMNTAELSWALTQEVSAIAPDHFLPVLVDAIAMATKLHEGQWRKNRGPHQRTPYSEHPLRNALRAVLLGVTDQPTILANLFHDTVEDQPTRMVELGDGGHDLVRIAAGDEGRLQELALMWLEDRYRHEGGAELIELVYAVTNPIPAPGATKAELRTQYASNVEVKIRGNAKVFIIKLMDFFDNGAGLHHNDVPGNEKMIKHLVVKYFPIPDIFLDELESNLSEISAMISDEGLLEVRTKLANTKERLVVMADRHGVTADTEVVDRHTLV